MQTSNSDTPQCCTSLRIDNHARIRNPGSRSKAISQISRKNLLGYKHQNFNVSIRINLERAYEGCLSIPILQNFDEWTLAYICTKALHRWSSFGRVRYRRQLLESEMYYCQDLCLPKIFKVQLLVKTFWSLIFCQWNTKQVLQSLNRTFTSIWAYGERFI